MITNTTLENQTMRYLTLTEKESLLKDQNCDKALFNLLMAVILTESDWRVYCSEFMKGNEPDIFSISAFRKRQLQLLKMPKREFLISCKRSLKSAIQSLTFYPLDEEDVMRAEEVLHNEAEQERFYDDYMSDIGSNPVKFLHHKTTRVW